ncbi:hypothetical protein HDK90DRAFT_57649 [Phyllosticta capitalensis]|uniref:Uncharacterized protein n=1 Tax=Phyllosticta capitalensis TaxID=121624 RepID=A0ABR1YEJ8_9PEZI
MRAPRFVAARAGRLVAVGWHPTRGLCRLYCPMWWWGWGNDEVVERCLCLSPSHSLAPAYQREAMPARCAAQSGPIHRESGVVNNTLRCNSHRLTQKRTRKTCTAINGAKSDGAEFKENTFIQPRRNQTNPTEPNERLRKGEGCGAEERSDWLIDYESVLVV